MRTWQIQEAKSKFSQVINKALLEGPQEITKNGVTTAYIVSSSEFEKSHKPSFKQVLREFPQDESLILSERNQDTVRDISL